MAIAYTIVKKGVAGNMRINIVDLTLDDSYAANGYAITAASCGVGTIHQLVPVVSTGEGVQAQYIVSTGKLKLIKGSDSTTVTTGEGDYQELATNDTLISASTKVRCTVIGDMITGS